MKEQTREGRGLPNDGVPIIGFGVDRTSTMIPINAQRRGDFGGRQDRDGEIGG